MYRRSKRLAFREEERRLCQPVKTGDEKDKETTACKKHERKSQRPDNKTLSTFPSLFSLEIIMMACKGNSVLTVHRSVDPALLLRTGISSLQGIWWLTVLPISSLSLFYTSLNSSSLLLISIAWKDFTSHRIIFLSLSFLFLILSLVFIFGSEIY